MTDEFDPLTLHPTIIEAAAWRLCSELARRHPQTTRIVELHPGGGQYDCLALVTRDEQPVSLLHANRVGSIHANPGAEDRWQIWTWTDYLTADDVREFLGSVEDVLDLRPPSSVPAATPWTLSWRAIAAAVSSEVLGVVGLRALSGMLDTSGGEGGPRDELFEAFPAARQAAREPTDTDMLRQPAYRFWFLVRGDDPTVALEADTGRCWWQDGSEHQLHDDYVRNGRHLAATVARCLSPALR